MKVKRHTLKTMWNPTGKRIVYLHLNRNKDESVYFRVDSTSEDVTVICLRKEQKRGRAFCFGIYKLRYLTFISNYGHWAAHWGTDDLTMYGVKMAHVLKVTTRNQYVNAFREAFKGIKIPIELGENNKDSFQVTSAAEGCKMSFTGPPQLGGNIVQIVCKTCGHAKTLSPNKWVAPRCPECEKRAIIAAADALLPKNNV